MTIPAPESWETAVAPYGIRAPKATAPALKLPTALQRMGEDVSAALAEFGLPPVVSGHEVVAASAAARDAHWGVPSSSAERLALQALGATTVRTDTGVAERYYAARSDGGTNAGGRDVAGWASINAARHVEFTGNVSVGNGTDATLGTLTRDDARTTDKEIAAASAPSVIRLQPGLYSITLNANIVGATATGLTLLGMKDAAGGIAFRVPQGVGNGTLLAAYPNFLVTTPDTDLTTYLYQTSGGTRTVASRVAVTKLGGI